MNIHFAFHYGSVYCVTYHPYYLSRKVSEKLQSIREVVKPALPENLKGNAIFDIKQHLSPPRSITGIGDLLKKADKMLEAVVD